MNFTAASRTATAQSVSQVLFVAVEALEFGDARLQGCCTLGRMFDFIQSGLRLILVGAASLVLALTGIILSIVAAVRTAYMRWRGIQDVTPVGPDREPSSTSPLLSRDRDVPHTPSPRTPVRHRSTHTLQRSPKSAGRSSRPTSPSRLRSSPEPMLPSEEHPIASTSSTPSPPKSRKHRRRLSSKLAEIGLPSIDSAMEYVEPVSPVSSGRSPRNARAAPSSQGVTRALTLPTQTTSDSSSTGPSSIGSGSTEEKSRLERSRSPSRRVLQRLRDHHSQFRERCLTRVHSMPNAKAAKPAPRRTDPYQAPYYFPTPLSPDAGTYVEEVRKERQASPKVTDPLSFRQYWEPPTIPLPSPRSSPKSKEQSLPPAPPEIIVSDAPPTEPITEPKAEATSARPALREVSHRWSWHLPLHPHLPKKHSVDPVQPEAQAEKPAVHTKFFFGHHRRRNGTASEDMQTKRTSLSMSPAS
ncbi:hypothetical protein C8Q79DRAFT_89638 [Trametes meyenii]|nr:hypothetical protein C8Q79DRAFT_89638 [Trametes meyenii]